MAGLVQKVTDKKISRRNFLKVSAAATASLAFAGCGNALMPVGANASTAAANGEGKWVTVACWHNCGGRCVNKALVVDGVVTRQKTDDTHPDSPEYFQNRACPRGRSQRHQIFSPDRLKYPMKRKHWEPGGGQKELRGKDEWVRISWDEAYDYIAKETKRIYDNYGPRSVLLNSIDYCPITLILGRMGGYVNSESTESYGTWGYAPLALGTSWNNYNADSEMANDRFDLKNAETIVLYGCNPAWASGGSPSYHYWQAKEAGAQFVYVGPSYNLSASNLEAKWIRVRPGTDTAFLLAVAYTMITEDNPVSNSIIDWDFLNRCAVGFDADHMPADATVKENFKDYVLGKYDGQAKTPEWATEICGTPVEDIKWYAREMRKDRKVMILHSYAAARCHGAEDLPQLYMTIGAMGGHMGKSGHACAGTYHYEAANAAPRLIKGGASRPPGYALNKVDDLLPGATMWKSILEKKYFYSGSVGLYTGQVSTAPGEWRDIDIKMIYSNYCSFLQSRMDVMNAIKVYRSVDFAVSHAYTLTATAQYCDIVLPVTTPWEGEQSIDYSTPAWINRETLIFYSPVTEPLFESKSDQKIVMELGERMGFNPKELYPYSQKQQYFDYVAGATVLEEDGKTWVPLVTITQKDITDRGIDNKPQQGKIGLTELLEQGVYQVKRHPGDNYGHIGYEDFRKDPEANPRPSKSGKLEIYCQAKADGLNQIGLKTDYKPYPTYHVPVLGYEASYSDWKNKVKGDYPYQMTTPHYLRRSHTTMDNVPWLREAFTNPAFINAQDAEEKGIKDGDTILIWNNRGKILRHASVINTVMPGCIDIPHGAWPDVHDDTGIDFGGTDNILLGGVENPFPTLSGYNTNLVNYEKYKGEAIPPDALKPQIIVNI